MYENETVAVVVPAFNEEKLIGRVIETMPSYVDKIIVVNDQSTDETVQTVQGYVEESPDRVVLIDLEENQGVGGAIAEGYKWARDHDMQMTAVMAGDAQMDPDDLEALIQPVANGSVDYAKGNRLFYGEAWKMIPKVRYLGNSALSLMTKIASGYWHVADSQTGYTVASLEVLKTIELDQIFKRYGMPNDMLMKLNVYDFRVCDVPVKPVYNVGEKSGIKIRKAIFSLSFLLLGLFIKRMFQKYVIRDFHPLVLFYSFGCFLLALDLPLVVHFFYRWHKTGLVPEITMLSIMFCTFLGFQSLLFAMLFDMEANKELKGQ